MREKSSGETMEAHKHMHTLVHTHMHTLVHTLMCTLVHAHAHTRAHTCTLRALAYFQSSLTQLDLITVCRPFHLIISTVLTTHNAPI